MRVNIYGQDNSLPKYTVSSPHTELFYKLGTSLVQKRTELLDGLP